MKFFIGKVQVHAIFVNHPGVCAGYRLFTSAGTVAFLPDHEPYGFLHSAKSNHMSPEETRKTATEERSKLVEFLHGSDLLILDTQYTDDEYQRHIGWGHGSITTAVALALDAAVRKLLLFHHDPNHDDAMIDSMVENARRLVQESGKDLKVEAAREGEEVIVST
jgi:phosphoribosyl 1,2-cyclic phosphodiesterase